MDTKTKERLENEIRHDLTSNCSTQFHYESAPEHLDNDIEELITTVLDITGKPTKNEKELWLVTMELTCGEYGQIWKKIFEVENKIDLSNDIALSEQVKDYLSTYYDDESELIDGIHYFHGGEVACKYEGAERIDSFEQLINALR